MSGSVTPARRQREDDDDSEAESFELSVDGEATPRSSASKRARVDDGPGRESDESDADNGDLLPDSFRRSPKTIGRGADMMHRHEPQPHQPGSIVRVTLVNFVTYTKAEFHPGPNLNMIIGPNGTGKSTLVCAICIGLGWSTSHLGRAKDVGEFVKHGAKRAEIEIELALDPEQHETNPVVTTRITKDGNKTEFLIDHKKSNKKGVQQLARSFSIQVDNLCQFLPQDRVVEFSALSGEERLVQTLRAAAPEDMTEWHDELKTMRKEQKTQRAEQEELFQSLKRDEDRQRHQEADVVRLRQRKELQERKSALEKLRPFPLYAVAKKRFNEAKAHKKDAEKEVQRLVRKQEPYRDLQAAKVHYKERTDKVVGVRERLVKRQEGVVFENKKKIDNVQTEIDGCHNEVNTEKEGTKSVSQSIPKLRQDISKIQKSMENPPEPFDAAAMNEKSRDLTRRIRELDALGQEMRQEMGVRKEEISQRKRLIQDAENEKEGLQSQVGRQVNKLPKDAAIAWNWIQANRDKFENDVWGPAIVECSVKDSAHAGAVEAVIQDSEKLAFTVTCAKDFEMLNHQLATVMRLNRVNIRNAPFALSSFRPSVPQSELGRYGFQSYILDLLDGPEAVLAMLCDNSRIHDAVFTSGDISNQQFNDMQRSPLSLGVTATRIYRINRRREYGDTATSTRVNDRNPARFWTDTPIDYQRERELDAEIAEKRDEIDQIQLRVSELANKGKTHRPEYDNLQGQIEAIDKDKSAKQKQLASFNGLPVRLQTAQDKLSDALERLKGSKGTIRHIEDKIDNFTVKKGQAVLDFANSLDALRNFHAQLFEAQILEIEAKSDLEQLQAEHEEEERLLEECQRQAARATAEAAQLLKEGKQLEKACQQAGNDFNPTEEAIYAEIGEWTPESMEDEIQSVDARITLAAGGGNANTIKEFEARAERIETKKARRDELSAVLADLIARIEELKDKWEPRLDDLVDHISAAFRESCGKIGTIGEVVVHKDDDFEQWAIHIKIKFRATEELSILDSHRQSGGERAVSTIFYLMALQSLARAPFRVVDEINQGMDPRNERMVHSRMVDIACAEHTSQYFLITPKLLSGLQYHPNMKVHCIASGEYMPSDHRDLDFGALARKALAVRARAGGVEVAG